MVVTAGLITSAVLGAAFLESWQLVQDDQDFCCDVQLRRGCVHLPSGGFSHNSSDFFLHWSNGSIIKSGGFKLDKTSGGIQPASQMSSECLRMEIPSTSLGPVPCLLYLRGRNFCAASLAAAFPCFFVHLRAWLFPVTLLRSE